MPENNFGQDVEFLKKYVGVIELSNSDGARIAVVPDYQGRTMTSTSAGSEGTSYGYINYDCISSGKHDPQINLYGGEDRMWISPEGGQFSVFFDPGADMEYANWRTPPVLDTEAFELVRQDSESASFTKTARLVNWSGFEFRVQLDRDVVLLERSTAAEFLDVSPDQLDAVSLVAHESYNRLTNIGDAQWQPATGLIGIWNLCMNKPSPGATLLVPFKKGDVESKGPIVNADYFGKLDESRLQIDEQAGLIFFLGDGNLRSKLGLTFERVQDWLGSWDKERGVLSVVQFNLPKKAPNGYNNNLWEHQDKPYSGDVINGYNDGPNESGEKLGGFFELETISPALSLAPKESFTHIHRTIRMEGDRETLSSISKKVFGVSIDEIESKLSG